MRQVLFVTSISKNGDFAVKNENANSDFAVKPGNKNSDFAIYRYLA